MQHPDDGSSSCMSSMESEGVKMSLMEPLLSKDKSKRSSSCPLTSGAAREEDTGGGSSSPVLSRLLSSLSGQVEQQENDGVGEGCNSLEVALAAPSIPDNVTASSTNTSTNTNTNTNTNPRVFFSWSAWTQRILCLLRHPTWQEAQRRPMSLRSKVRLALAVLLSIVGTELVDREVLHLQRVSPTQQGGGGGFNPAPSPAPAPVTPSQTREQRVTACAAKLSTATLAQPQPSLFPFAASSAQGKAVQWFLHGPTQNDDTLLPSTLQDCTVNSDFATLYALIVLRESLNLTSTWTDQALQVDGGEEHEGWLAKACRRWHCLDCIDLPQAASVDKTNHHTTSGSTASTIKKRVSKLHLASLPHLAGTLPYELYILGPHFTRLELYNSSNLVGPLDPPHPTSTTTTTSSMWTHLTQLQSVLLHRTNLQGSIPTAMGELTQLQELFLDHSELFGDMPGEVCQLRTGGNLERLHADCKAEVEGGVPRVGCRFPECCTHCYA